MAEVTETPAATLPIITTPPSTADVVVDPPITEKTPDAPEESIAVPVAEEPLTEPVSKSEEKKISLLDSFKEETNVVGDLPELEKKALDELKLLVQEALNKHEFTDPPVPEVKVPEVPEVPEVATEEEIKELVEEKTEEIITPPSTTAEAPKTEESSATVEAPKIEEKKDDIKSTPTTTLEAPKPEVKKEETKSTPPTTTVEAPKTEEKKEEIKTTPLPATVETPKTEEKKEEIKTTPKTTVEAPKAEVKKEEIKITPPPATVEVPKVEATKAEKTLASAPPTTVETPKPEDKTLPIPTPAPSATVEEPKPEEKSVVDEDGAKTVEAIEETIVPISTPTAEPEVETETLPPPPPEEVSIYGIPLLHDERSDVILLKFLRARDFKPKDALTMLKNTVRWRKQFKIDELLEEDLGNEWDKVVFTTGVDKLGHPVTYNVYSGFQNESFANKENRAKFLRWRIQFLEKSVRSLDFSPSGINSIVNVNDFKNSPGLGKRSLWQFIKQAIHLVQDNYPECLAKQVNINVPWWYLPYYKAINSFTSQRTKSKTVFAGPSKSTATIFQYITPQEVPVKYGGLSRDGEQEFSSADGVSEFIIKPTSKHTLEFPVSETCLFLWELRVVGWDVTYEAQFEPTNESSYTVIVSKPRKLAASNEPVINDTFKISEPGKILITLDNLSGKKKKLVYRFKTKTSA